MSSEMGSVKIAGGLPVGHASAAVGFIEDAGISSPLPSRYSARDSYSGVITASLKSDRIEVGKVTCFLTILPSLLNYLGSVHGGAVAAIAERVAVACARTVVGEDKDLFLGELGINYLSATTQNAELIVEGSVIRSGRNVTTVSVNFMHKDTRKLAYSSRATFFNMPLARL